MKNYSRYKAGQCILFLEAYYNYTLQCRNKETGKIYLNKRKICIYFYEPNDNCNKETEVFLLVFILGGVKFLDALPKFLI